MARNPVKDSRAEKRFPGLSETGLEWWGRLRIEILPIMPAGKKHEFSPPVNTWPQLLSDRPRAVR